MDMIMETTTEIIIIDIEDSPDRDLNPGPVDYESTALPLSYRGSIFLNIILYFNIKWIFQI